MLVCARSRIDNLFSPSVRVFLHRKNSTWQPPRCQTKPYNKFSSISSLLAPRLPSADHPTTSGMRLITLASMSIPLPLALPLALPLFTIPPSLIAPSPCSFLHSYLSKEPSPLVGHPSLKLHVVTNDVNIDLLYPLSQKTVDVFGAPISLAGNMSKYEEVRSERRKTRQGARSKATKRCNYSVNSIRSSLTPF